MSAERLRLASGVPVLEHLFARAARVTEVNLVARRVGQELVECEVVQTLFVVEGVPAGLGVVAPIDIPRHDGVGQHDIVGQRHGVVGRQDCPRLEVVREVRRVLGHGQTVVVRVAVAVEVAVRSGRAVDLQQRRFDLDRSDDHFAGLDQVVDDRGHDGVVLVRVLAVEGLGHGGTGDDLIARIVGVRWQGEEQDTAEHQVEADAGVRPQGRPVGVEGMGRGGRVGWELSRHDGSSSWNLAVWYGPVSGLLGPRYISQTSHCQTETQAMVPLDALHYCMLYINEDTQSP